MGMEGRSRKRKPELSGFESPAAKNLRANPNALFGISEKMFDQDEDVSGEKTNLATGKEFDNSTDKGFGSLTFTDPKKLKRVRTEDMLGDIPPEDPEDPATKWLRENDKKH